MEPQKGGNTMAIPLKSVVSLFAVLLVLGTAAIVVV